MITFIEKDNLEIRLYDGRPAYPVDTGIIVVPVILAGPRVATRENTPRTLSYPNGYYRQFMGIIPTYKQAVLSMQTVPEAVVVPKERHVWGIGKQRPGRRPVFPLADVIEALNDEVIPSGATVHLYLEPGYYLTDWTLHGVHLAASLPTRKVVLTYTMDFIVAELQASFGPKADGILGDRTKVERVFRKLISRMT